ncbi:MAG: RNA polymerase sigma factor [Paludibacter sp.]|nr:RNA polymerase sigma factor [Paludibacter sp.]
MTATSENLTQLITENQSKLKSFIRHRVNNAQDAEDILQDVFYQLVKTVNAALTPIEEVSAWLYRVAKNLIINKSKKKTEEELPAYTDYEGNEVALAISAALFAETAASPETEFLRSLVWEEVETALVELPPEQREIFELTEIDGIPVKAIAEMTGVAVNTLLSRKHYAVLHLRKRLKELYEEFYILQQ